MCAVASPFVALPVLLGIAAGVTVGAVVTNVALHRKNLSERSIAVADVSPKIAQNCHASGVENGVGKSRNFERYKMYY